jgi:hypothetical protein
MARLPRVVGRAGNERSKVPHRDAQRPWRHALRLFGTGTCLFRRAEQPSDLVAVKDARLPPSARASTLRLPMVGVRANSKVLSKAILIAAFALRPS